MIATGRGPVVYVTTPVAAGSTPQVTAVITDQYANPLSGAALDSLTLTIADTATGAVVNGCYAADVLNVGRGTVDGSGNLALDLGAADTATDELPSLRYVRRSLIVGWTYDGGLGSGWFTVVITVENLSVNVQAP